MDRRVFFQSKLYDYTDIREAERHIDEMRSKEWIPKLQDGGTYIYNNGGDKYKFSVEYMKEL